MKELNINSKNICKIARANKKSILITYEDGTFEKCYSEALLNYYIHLPSEHINNKAIISFFENRKENNISDGLYTPYNESFKIKSMLENK